MGLCERQHDARQHLAKGSKTVSNACGSRTHLYDRTSSSSLAGPPPPLPPLQQKEGLTHIAIPRKYFANLNMAAKLDRPPREGGTKTSSSDIEGDGLQPFFLRFRTNVCAHSTKKAV